MRKRAKSKKVKSNSTKFRSKSKSTSLFPEFDEINQAILQELGELEDVTLVCQTCGTEFVYDAQFAFEVCNECQDGYMLPVDGENNVIKLHEGLKSGNAFDSISSGTKGSLASSSSYQDGYVYEKHNHPGDKVIFEANDKKLFASNSTSLREWSGNWNLIVDLAGVVQIPNVTPFVSNSAPAKYRELSKLTYKEKELPSDILRLNWTDMGVPPVKLNFWDKMWDLLPEKTVVCCIGGHGRTGTFLTAMMIAQGYDYWDALEHVRKEHCSKAVESVNQEKYLHGIYVERLERELKVAISCNDEDQIKQLAEDLTYAKDNVPSYQSNTATKGGSSYSVGFPHQNGDGTKPFKDYGVGTLIRFYSPGQQHSDVTPGSDLAEAIATKRPVKTVQEGKGPQTIYVEECVDKGCNKLDCSLASHQDWIQWEYSMTSIEVQYSQHQ